MSQGYTDLIRLFKGTTVDYIRMRANKHEKAYHDKKQADRLRGLANKTERLTKTTKELLKFIEINDINDQALGDYDRDTWRSDRFKQLINEVEKNL